MKMLFKKMLRDLKDHKIQFLSIFLMAFLGVYVFTGICAESAGIEAVSSDYYNETNLADGWIYGDSFTKDQLDDIKSLDEVKDAYREMVIPTVGNYSSDPDITLHVLEEDQTISKFHVFKGEDFNLSDEDGIWIDKRFADARGLDVGDNYTLKINGMKMTKEIRGIVYSPEYVYYIQEGSIVTDFSKVGYVYVSKEAIVFPIVYNAITIDAYDNPMDKKFTSVLDDALGSENYSQFLARENNVGVRQLNEEIAQHQMFEGIFPIIFVLVALLTLLTTMSRVIASQRTQIGTLKAMGYDNRSIIFHYLSYGFFLSFAGALLGLFIGPLTMPYLFYPSMSAFYCLPKWEPAWQFSFLVVASLMVIFSVIVTYISVRSINNENPADSIRPKVPKGVSSGFIEKLAIWKRMGFNSRWNYRDAKRNKVRAIMSIFGVFACALLVMSAFGMYDSMNDVKDWQYEDIYQYNSKLNLEGNITDEQISHIIEDTDGEAIMENPIEVKFKDKKKVGTLTVLNDSKYYKTTDINRNQIRLDSDGVAISSRLAEILDLKVGDTIKWHISGNNKWVESEITEMYSVPVGQGIIMSPKTLDKTGYNYTETGILTAEDVSKNYTGVSSITTRDELSKGWDDMSEAMYLMIFVLIFFAAILSIVVLYNLGLLSFTEIQRELATLKVLGFDSTALRRLLLTQNLWFSTIGFILAIPASYFLMQAMMGTTGEDYYFPTHIYLWNLIATFIITFGLSVLVNLMFSRKIKSVNMVESLKSNE